MEIKTLLRANIDRVAAVALALIGVIALIIGWIGVSGTGLTAEQNPYLISGGLLGFALIAIGCTVWLSADLQDEWRRLDAIEQRLDELASPPAADAGRAEQQMSAPAASTPGRKPRTSSRKTQPASR